MNAAEHIVECYYRLVENCFTLDDVKVKGGVNRQIDLLAVNLKDGCQYHIETSVTHRETWAPDIKKLEEIFLHKFLGIPEKREGKKTDSARGVNYRKKIDETYESVGLDPKKIQRVFVCWISKCEDDHLEKDGVRMSIVSFRDTILPKLLDKVGTANYDDEVLRSLSFIKELKKPRKKKKAKSTTVANVG